MQLIDRHALLKNVYDNPPEKARMTYAEWCRKCIYEAPTIEAEPVRHGRWIEVHLTRGEDFFRCSECGCYLEKIYFANDYNVSYCPNCGADMREGGADNG